MAKVIVSGKQIVSIEEFMVNYLGVVYDKGKLTHRDMCMYLMEKGKKIPDRVNFNNVNKESLLNGTYIVVKDKNSQILIYKNPRCNSLESLLQELQSSANLNNLKKVRRQLLSDLGYRETVDGAFNQENVDYDYAIEKPNRQKQFVMRNKNLVKKTHY